VVPSLFEGFGLPAAEAMASGLPIISTSAGALPEVVGEDGKAGIVVPPRNPSALAGAVLSLVNNSRLREKIGKAARERAISKFTWTASAEKVVEVYEEEIKKKRERKN